MTNLERKLTELIAKEHGLSFEEITLEFIRQERKKLYAKPEHRFEFDIELGGYDDTGLEVPNRFEIETEEQANLAFLSHFRKKRADFHEAG